MIRLILALLIWLVAAPSWAADFAVVQAALNTSTGNQTFQSSESWTPKCALFFLTYGTANGTAVDHAFLSIGATDGTRNRAVAARARDALATTSSANFGSVTNSVITLTTGTPTTADGTAVFNAWTAGGVTINITDAPPSAYLMNVVLFGPGAVANCYVGHAVTPGVVGNATDVTDPGFTPDLVITSSVINALSDAANTHARPSLGIVVNDGSNTQRSVSLHDTSVASPSALVAIVDTNSVAYNAAAGASAAEAQLQDFDASGFSLYQRVATDAITVLYMAIDLQPGVSAKVLTSASPTGTGDHTITGAGWRPQFRLMLHSAALAVDTVYTDGSAEVIGLSACTATACASSATASDDNANPSNTESITNNIAVSLRKDAAAFMTATFSAFTSDGSTDNYSVADASARQRAVLFIQESRRATGRPIFLE